ncbi:MAG TPA: twin-arginine translocation signal domain-containing protein, partial [bacterium]|nr:twin-arginine translocation signal domain-containing protein [bacterium]
MMSEQSVSRRRFIQGASAAALALGTPRRILGANDKISLGFIGTGGRGRRLATVVTHVPDFQVVSVCDLVEDRMDQTLEICEQYKPTPKKYLDFREML